MRHRRLQATIRRLVMPVSTQTRHIFTIATPDTILIRLPERLLVLRLYVFNMVTILRILILLQVDDGIALNIEELSRVTSAYTLNGEWMGCYPVHDY